MRPPARKNRGQRGIIKDEPTDDAPASLSPSPPTRRRRRSAPEKETKKSLIVKLKLPSARPPPQPIKIPYRPSKIVKLKIPPIPPRPQKLVKLPMRPSSLVGVANASNEMRIEAQVEAIERRQREKEKASSRPQTRSARGLPPPLSPPRLHSPALEEMMERTTAPRRVEFDMDVQGLPPPLSPPSLRPMTPSLPEGLGPYPPGFEPGAELASPPNQPPPMLQITRPLPRRVLALRGSTASTKPAAPRQEGIVATAREHTLTPTKSAAPRRGGIVAPARKPTLTPRELNALLKPPRSNFLAPPPHAHVAKSKPKRGRPGGISRQRQQPSAPQPRPTEDPPGPPNLYPYGHEWELEPKDMFIRRFERLNAADDAKKEEDAKWSALVEESCKKFHEEYPNADKEWMAWKSARRPANWETYYRE